MKTDERDVLEAKLDAVHAEVRTLLDASDGLPQPLRAGLDRLQQAVQALSETAARAKTEGSAQARRVDEILQVLYGLAGLDFTRRASVVGDGPLDALAASANMLAEELEASQRSLQEARKMAEAATEAKTQFLAKMSHEIRTPLTALLGFADLLAAPKLSESDRLNYAMIIRRNGDHLLAVINDILDISRIEAGKLELEKIVFSPTDVLRDAELLMRVRAAEKALSFDVALETAVPTLVIGDPTRVRQIVLNLVGNAVKFTSEGGVKVRARFDVATSALTIAVADTGMGIAEEQRERLFIPFEQADVSMSRRFGGSGMGLSICKSLALMMGGDITVQSEVGRGSVFVLTIPCALPEDAAWTATIRPPAKSAIATPNEPRGFSGKVLLVEDGPDNQILISTLLRASGVTVAIVENGELGHERTLAAWRDGTPYDLVLMDMQMPVLDGYEATWRLRSDGYPGPVVALTAHAMEGERERCIASGCTDYLRKPIDRTALAEMLARYLKPGEAGRERAQEEEPLDSTLADDPVIGPLVAHFIDGMPERIAKLRTESRKPDRGELGRLLHQMIGMAGGFGFESITLAAQDAQATLHASPTDRKLDAQIDALVTLCRRARAPANKR